MPLAGRLATALLVAALGAQQPRDPAVTGAWLVEVLDLDSAAAARTYARLAHDSQQPVTTRWLAAARLVELQRLGVARDARGVAATDAPAALQPLFASLAPVPDLAKVTETAKAAADQPPGELVATLRAANCVMPTLRPLTPDVMLWEPEQTTDPRTRGRRLQRNELADWLHALQILRHELDGDRKRADARRTLFFDQWKPPAWGRDPAELVPFVKQRLMQVRQQRETSPQLARDLARLDEAVDRAAAQGPAAVLSLLARLPILADALMRPAGGDGR